MFRNGCRSAVTSANNSLAAALSAAGRERRSAAPPVSVCGLPLAVVKVPTRASNRKRKPLFRTGSICFSVQFSSIIRSLPAPISPPALRPAPRRSRSNTSAKLRTPPGPGALPGARRGPATSYFLLQFIYNSELSQVRSFSPSVQFMLKCSRTARSIATAPSIPYPFRFTRYTDAPFLGPSAGRDSADLFSHSFHTHSLTGRRCAARRAIDYDAIPSPAPPRAAAPASTPLLAAASFFPRARFKRAKSKPPIATSPTRMPSVPPQPPLQGFLQGFLAASQTL